MHTHIYSTTNLWSHCLTKTQSCLEIPNPCLQQQVDHLSKTQFPVKPLSIPKNPFQNHNQMAQKYLHELLTEAQEPFLLKNYIADKRSKLKKLNSLTNKTKSISKPRFCNQYCFYSQTQSPEYTNSPFSGVPSPAPAKNRAQLKITQFDLSLLLEAAEKVKGSNLGKTQTRNGAFGVFGSIIKKFKKSGPKCENDKSLGGYVKNEDPEMDFGCSCSSSRQNNGGENVERESVERESDEFSLSENCFRLSPVSQQNCSSTYLRSQDYSPVTSAPEYFSPVTSPTITDIQGDGDGECIPRKHCGEEEKDQFSPVSILDPPFEYDMEQHEDEEDEDDYNIECSYSLVQRAKEQLLERLLRFEKLAELDPIELERSILERKTDDDEDDDDNDDEDLEEYKNDNLEKNFKFDTKRHMLVSDLIAKNKRKGDEFDERKIAAKMVCKRVSFREKMELKTKIDMIVEFDMRSEVDHGWKTNHLEKFEETLVDIELSIFDVLIDELL